MAAALQPVVVSALPIKLDQLLLLYIGYDSDSYTNRWKESRRLLGTAWRRSCPVLASGHSTHAVVQVVHVAVQVEGAGGRSNVNTTV